MINLLQIAEGFINSSKKTFGVADETVEEEAKRRYVICLSCPLISDAKGRCDKKKCEGNKCGCNCKLAWKIRSSSKCPLKKW